VLDGLVADDAARRDVELIQRTAEQATALTRQLLAFSRKQILQPRVLDLRATLATMEPLIRRLIGEDVDLVVVPGAGVGRARVDPSQMEQVVLNLAVNARDAMPDGGRLTISLAHVDVDESAAAGSIGLRVGCYVLLSVTDTGTGMDAVTRARLFEPFFTTKEAGKGTGLGLATVYGIVKQSGGHLAVHSAPGRGTSVRVYVPCADESQSAAPAASRAAGAPARSRCSLPTSSCPG
jgi:two-component system cell cycle sensor histidine kinase/response regulator CckA